MSQFNSKQICGGAWKGNVKVRNFKIVAVENLQFRLMDEGGAISVLSFSTEDLIKILKGIKKNHE